MYALADAFMQMTSIALKEYIFSIHTLPRNQIQDPYDNLYACIYIFFSGWCCMQLLNTYLN